ncbi:MAG: hypothetical protein GY699_06245 [Desulfobacteraceae bacterium]|nr:hypothetical protein [Desulfobacteraceae bacterium]
MLKRSIVKSFYSTWVTIMVFVLAAPLAWTGEFSTTVIQSPFSVGSARQQAGTSLELDPNIYSEMSNVYRGTLQDFIVSEDETIDLELIRFEITRPDTLIFQGTDTGNIPVEFHDIILFRGKIAGAPDSSVVLGVSPRGMTGIISDGMETMLLSPRNKNTKSAGGSRTHILYRGSEVPDVYNIQRLPLTTDDVNQIFSVPQEPLSSEKSEESPLTGTFQTCRLALECDYEYWSQFNNMSLALDYIFVLFGKIGDMFERDVNVKLALTYIRIWTTVNDPYSYVGGDITGLVEFQNYWNANHNPGKSNPVVRDLAHLLSSRSVGAWANVGVLCNYLMGFSISGGNALLPTLAENLFHDIRYAGHEIGHNFNAIHTHCFNPPIDQCDTETQCNQVKDCSTAPSTLMSYCHQCPGGGNNILEQFHPLNVQRMRSHIENSCLKAAQNPCYVDWLNTSEFENGTAAFPYNTVKEGVEGVLPSGTIIIENGNYNEPLIIWQPMAITTSEGTVVIGE